MQYDIDIPTNEAPVVYQGIEIYGSGLVSPKFLDIVKHAVMSDDFHKEEIVKAVVFSVDKPVDQEGVPLFACYKPPEKLIAFNLGHHFDGAVDLVRGIDRYMSIRGHIWYNMILSLYQMLCFGLFIVADTEGDMSELDATCRDMADSALSALCREYDVEPPGMAYEPYFGLRYMEFYVREIKEGEADWCKCQDALHDDRHIHYDDKRNEYIEKFRSFMRYTYGGDPDHKDPVWDQEPKALEIGEESTPEDTMSVVAMPENEVLWKTEAGLEQTGFSMESQRPLEPIFTMVVGVKYEDRFAVCEQLYKGAILTLDREPDNPYDPNAIGVLFKGRKCGYIPRDLASNLANRMDRGLHLEAVVTELPEGDNFAIEVNAQTQEKSETYFEENATIDDFSTDFMDWISDEEKSEIDIETLEGSFELTEEQKKIIGYDVKGDSILNIIAFAGTGKTTTLLEYSKARPDLRFLYVAFNKSVQLEAEKKFPSNVTCKTSHSLAWRRFGSLHRPRIIENLRLNTVKSVLSLDTYQEARIVAETLSNFLISADPKFSKTHLPSQWQDTPNTHFHYISKAAKIWVMMRDANNKNLGMLHDCYLKEYQLSMPKLDFDCILLDEAQDTNPVVADIVISQKCPKIIVGDPHQQIYAFRGARDLMRNINAEKTFYLTYSFRFGNEIAWIANKILHTFKGETQELKGVRPRRKMVDFKDYAIIARTNAMVFDEAASLCQNHKIAFLGGIDGYRFDDIADVYLLYSGKRLEVKNSYIRSFTTYSGLKAFAERASDWELKSKCNVVEKYEEQIPILVEQIKAVTIERTLADVLLTTAHKSKGDQFSKVRLCSDFQNFFLNDELVDKNSIDSNEFNLLYVAVTRAKESLCVTSTLDWYNFISFNKQHGHKKILEFLNKTKEENDVLPIRLKAEPLQEEPVDKVIQDSIEQNEWKQVARERAEAAKKTEQEAAKPDSKVIARDGIFIAYANGIVYDKSTGLEWYVGPDRGTTWYEAKAWVENLNVAGGGWRMPTNEALKTLYREEAGERNMTPLLKTTGWWVWGEVRGSSSAWGFAFGSGNENGDSRDSSSTTRGFAVRSRSDGYLWDQESKAIEIVEESTPEDTTPVATVPVDGELFMKCEINIWGDVDSFDDLSEEEKENFRCNQDFSHLISREALKIDNIHVCGTCAPMYAFEGEKCGNCGNVMGTDKSYPVGMRRLQVKLIGTKEWQFCEIKADLFEDSLTKDNSKITIYDPNKFEYQGPDDDIGEYKHYLVNTADIERIYTMLVYCSDCVRDIDDSWD